MASIVVTFCLWNISQKFASRMKFKFGIWMLPVIDMCHILKKLPLSPSNNTIRVT